MKHIQAKLDELQTVAGRLARAKNPDQKDIDWLLSQADVLSEHVDLAEECLEEGEFDDGLAGEVSLFHDTVLEAWS